MAVCSAQSVVFKWYFVDSLRFYLPVLNRLNLFFNWGSRASIFGFFIYKISQPSCTGHFRRPPFRWFQDLSKLIPHPSSTLQFGGKSKNNMLVHSTPKIYNRLYSSPITYCRQIEAFDRY